MRASRFADAVLEGASRVDRVLDLFSRQGQIAQALAGRIGDRVRNRCRSRPLPGLAAAKEGKARSVDDVNVDLVGNGVEPQDRIGLPVDARDSRVVEGDGLV